MLGHFHVSSDVLCAFLRRLIVYMARVPVLLISRGIWYETMPCAQEVCLRALQVARLHLQRRGG